MTVILKVNMHCEECQKQVKKALKKLQGVESIAVDAKAGKVTVVGTVAASTLVKKLAKAGKYAALWSASAAYNYSKANAGGSEDSSSICRSKAKHFTINSGSALAHSASTSTSTSTKTCNNNKFAGVSHEILSVEENAAGEGSNEYLNMAYHYADQLPSSRKGSTNKGGKKVSFQGASAAPAGPIMSHASRLAMAARSSSSSSSTAYSAHDPYFHTHNALLAGTTLTSAVDKNPHFYNTMVSVDYATNMFSDENAHSCSIM